MISADTSSVNHYVSLFNEKREELEEQQRHLNVGLDKLKDTVEQVDQLQKSLAVKRGQLQAKNQEANLKLRQMVADQQEAEAKKAASIEIQAALERQDEFIQQRQEIVQADLAQAEPAVLEALAAVGNIKKQHLAEVRSMANPPEAVRLAMESACTLLGHQIDSWKAVQSIIRREDFVSSIQHFDTDKMTKSIRNKMMRDYIARPEYNFEAVNRASRACGPLVQWVIAQVRFSEILDKVEPLRAEVASLEKQANDTKQQARIVEETVEELEVSIARYKDEYAVLISDTQSIKTEMDRVQIKVDRSQTLLQSLSSEQARWEHGSMTFETEMSTIAGDNLISAAFLAYGGFFDQHYREVMRRNWTEHLSDAGINFKQNLALPEFLSTADEQLKWQSNSLPADALCTENAIMLKRFNRYPLIIDPTGQATTFLQNEFKDRKITVTSFLDEAFLKSLESALRFGNPLLIQDVEHLDPILNSVLNGELRRTGGRVLIRIGNNDIDFSPSFTLFLSTRDPSVEFPPDICSRVTFVNFTMTRGSLQTQTLDRVLRVERPDVDAKRRDLMKLQGEFQVRLRRLERLLLQALNESEGSILEDDKVIGTLEKLKKEAAEITRKVQDTELIMREVEGVTAEYLPLAQASSGIYFALEQLATINHFYQYSLAFFLEIFDYVLVANPNLNGVKDPDERKRVLLRDIFLVTYKRTSRSLLHQDHLVLASTLAALRLRGGPDSAILDELDIMADLTIASGATSLELDAQSRRHLESGLGGDAIMQLEASLRTDREAWLDFATSSEPETKIPQPWKQMRSKSCLIAGAKRMLMYPGLQVAVRRILLTKLFRPDRLNRAISSFVDAALGADLVDQSAYELSCVVADEISAAHPIALVSVPGYDASFRVESLCRTQNHSCVTVAMGSAEGYAQADQAIANAARSGGWVLLKNVHLAPSWLGQLEKRLHSLSPDPRFRLFLTMETTPVIPVNILRQSRIIMNEPAPGIRAGLLDTLHGLPAARVSSGPAEKPRLFFLLAWFHAVVQERLRFIPLGWSKSYEFNDSDFDAAVVTIDSWIGALAKGRANINPAHIPWTALRTLIKQAVYGGRVDSDYDQGVVDAFVDQIFTPKAYDPNFALVNSETGEHDLLAPEGTQMSAYIKWAHGLPESEPPAWASLPQSAESLVAIAAGEAVLGKIRLIQTIDDQEDEPSATSPAAGQQPPWMSTLADNAKQWLKRLPEDLSAPPHDRSPLGRFFTREATVGRKIVQQVRNDLLDMIKLCDGELKQTNELRALVADVSKGKCSSRMGDNKADQSRSDSSPLAQIQDAPEYVDWSLRCQFGRSY